MFHQHRESGLPLRDLGASTEGRRALEFVIFQTYHGTGFRSLSITSFVNLWFHWVISLNQLTCFTLIDSSPFLSCTCFTCSGCKLADLRSLLEKNETKCIKMPSGLVSGCWQVSCHLRGPTSHDKTSLHCGWFVPPEVASLWRFQWWMPPLLRVSQPFKIHLSFRIILYYFGSCSDFLWFLLGYPHCDK